MRLEFASQKNLGDINATVDLLSSRECPHSSPLLRRTFSTTINAVSLSTMLFVRVLFVIFSHVIANPIPIDRYSYDPSLDFSFGQRLSNLGPLNSDQKLDVPSSINHPPLELDVSGIQPLGFITAPDIVQISQSLPGQAGQDSYITSQAQVYQSFQCGGEKSVCCQDENLEVVGIQSMEQCNMSITAFFRSVWP